MRNKLETIKKTWTWNHKTVIVAIALFVANVYQAGYISLPTLEAEEISYTRPVATTTVPYSLAEEVEMRAYELRELNKNYDLEKYRQEALLEKKDEILLLSGDSPFIDYQALKEEFGY